MQAAEDGARGQTCAGRAHAHAGPVERLQHAKLRRHAVVICFASAEADAGEVVANQFMALGDRALEVGSGREVPIEFEVRQPVAHRDDRRATADRTEDDTDPIRGFAELVALRHGVISFAALSCWRPGDVTGPPRA